MNTLPPPPRARQCIVLPGDRCASDLARRICGDETRWREIVAVNPQKERSRVAGFDYLVDGERLYLPVSWPSDPHAAFATMPRRPQGPNRFEAGALPSVTLPQGWVDDDLRAVIVMGADLGVSDPKSLMYVWASETGNSAAQQLNPQTKLDLASRDPWSPFFAGGLNGSTAPVIRAMGFKSAAAWLSAPIRIQLQGIYRQYQNHVRALGEGFDARANKLGTTTAALIYAFNFLPAYAVNLRSATQAIVKAGSPFYDSNRVLDTSRKGYISLRDFETLTGPNRWPSGWPVYALANRLDALRADPNEIAMLGPTGSSIWDAIKGTWEELTGKRAHTEPSIVVTPTPHPVPPRVPLASHADRWSADDYWKATGVVLFAGFLLAYSGGLIRR